MATTRRRIQKYSRIWHRRLGTIIGIQFVFWTIGGFYFSWFHIDSIRGTDQRRVSQPQQLKPGAITVSIDDLLKKSRLKHVSSLSTGFLQGKPVVRLKQDSNKVETYNAKTGTRLSPIGRKLAITIAKADFSGGSEVVSADLVTTRAGEYKGAIPAFRVRFDNSRRTAVYVHVGSGTITARRNTLWRVFDFLWMLHIVDFDARENFNNWLLKILSLLGLITLASGYVLWASTSPWFKRRKQE